MGIETTTATATETAGTIVIEETTRGTGHMTEKEDHKTQLPPPIKPKSFTGLEDLTR
jgi:hypothetical protein